MHVRPTFRLFALGRAAVLAAAMAVAISACGSDAASPSIVDNDNVVAVHVSPSNPTVQVGATVTLSAVPVDAQGSAVSGRTVAFNSENTSVATVASNGMVTGVAVGTARVTATVDGQVGEAQVTVAAASGGPVASIALLPTNPSVAVGATIQLTAQPKDAQGNPVAGVAVAFTSSDQAVATVSSAGILTGIAVGSATITASVNSLSASTSLTVVAPAAGNIIDVSTGTTYQTIVGWEGSSGIGEVECDQTAFANYQTEVLDRVANELGVNRVRLHMRSGYENDADYFTMYRNGQIDYNTWKSHWYLAVNDNADPNVADPAHFFWSWPDYQIDVAVNPLRQRLAARGEHLYVTATFVDFLISQQKNILLIANPDEYAEYWVQAFTHMQQKYGWVPDAIELMLEPDGGGNGGQPGPMAKAMIVTAQRLQALGFTPEFIAPSAAAMANSVSWYDNMIKTPGVFPYLKELSYHRYNAVSTATVQGIASRGARDGIRTSMLEHLSADIDELMEDLTVGNVSAWQQFGLAYCSRRTAPGANGVYYTVNQSNPAAPIVTLTDKARNFRQIFLYVRAGAVRVGATSGNPAVIRPVAFRNTTGKYVLAVRATGAAAFTVRGMPDGTYGVSYAILGQSVTLPDLVVAPGGAATLSIPRDGVITLFGK